MKLRKFAHTARAFAEPYRINQGGKFHLKDFDPADTGDLKSEDKPKAQECRVVFKTGLFCS